ncbi:MAG: S8 family serine peptidase, partial [Nitrosotalea sp.]
MVKKENIMSKIGFFLIFILLFSLFPKTAMGSYDVDLPKNNVNIKTDQVSDLINFQPSPYQDMIKRYIVFGSGSVSDIVSRASNVIYGMDSNHGSLALGFFNQDEVSNLKLNGYEVIEDLPLEFDSVTPDLPVTEVSRIGNILGSNQVANEYGYTGNGIKIGIVDTGTDFTNPDVKDSVARDKNNVPVMIDADGQGLVLTNATFVANINSKGVIQNYTSVIPKNVTSFVYVTSKGVFLDLHKKGKGTYVQVYNSLYPKGGNPILNGTV